MRPDMKDTINELPAEKFQLTRPKKKFDDKKEITVEGSLDVKMIDDIVTFHYEPLPQNLSDPA